MLQNPLWFVLIVEMGNKQEIQSLLKKYLDAETTIQEENILRNYFIDNNEIDDHLKIYKHMFTSFIKSKEEMVNIDVVTAKLPKKQKGYYWMKIASSVILLIGVSYFGYMYKQNYDQQVAFNNTQMALTLLGDNINKAKSIMVYIDEFDEAKKQLFK